MVATRMSSSSRATRIRGAVLRQPALCDVEARQDFYARDQCLGHDLRGEGQRPQQTVNADTHENTAAQRLDVDVARAHLHRLLDEIVDGAHDRRAAGQIAKAVHALVGDGYFRVGWRCGAPVVFTEAFV